MPPLLLVLVACDVPTCLDGDASCTMPTPCPEIQYTCEGGYTEAYFLGPDDVPPRGMDTLGATGDVLIGNDQVVIVIEALDHPHYIAPAGGGILDYSIRGRGNDSLRHIFTATGLLPEEAAHYTSLEIIDDGDGAKAVQVVGTLDGYPDIPIATRYELRACEPGLRVRTEIANGTPDAISLYLTDAFYWGDRESLAFTPRPGGGFNHPSFGLSTIRDVFYDVPFMVAGLHSEPAATYGVVSCEDETLSGFQSVYVSAMGPAPRVFPARDWQIYERFILATEGPSVSKAADVAYDIRQMLWGDDYITVRGTIEAVGGHLGDPMRAAVALYDEDTPWTHVIPEDDGSFSARVPATVEQMNLEVEAFGQIVLNLNFDIGGEDVDLGTLKLPDAGEVTLDVIVDGKEDHALVFVVPADDETLERVSATTFGAWEPCAPLLGLPHGASPACNRVLVKGPTTVALPDGTYDFYTSAGLFSTLGAVRGVAVAGGTAESVDIEVKSLKVEPSGTLSADFHVHGAASFDSEIPDLDRVKAFLAARIDVIASTEHDVVSDYAEAMEDLDAAARMVLIAGTEATGHLLFRFREDYAFPQVIGHWIFWPVPYVSDAPYRGAAWDEKAEPGLLFTRMRDAGWDADDGVSQLNHPYGGSQFGRDYSWGTAMGLDQTKELRTVYDGTGQSLYFHEPEGADYANSDYDVQEVMNGTNNLNFLQYRSLWHYLLGQGIVRGGTANSDSHSLTENVLGTPRNLVFTSTSLSDFDLATFDADVRAGHILGTNGPVIVAAIEGDQPGTTAISPDDAATLEIAVRAAPWVPVDEVRIVVNGEVAQVVTDLTVPADPLGEDDIERITLSIPLSEILPASGDAWVVVEAGHALVEQEDLDCNGVPDTGDNNGDGAIDWHDVAELTEDPGVSCIDTVGPLAEPEEPERATPDWYFRTVTPGGYALAFTNPFLLDRDGNGYAGVP